MQVYINGPVHDDVVAAASKRYQVHLGFGPDAVPLDEVLPTVDAILMRGDVMDRERIGRAPRLRIIARHGVGVNNVDVQAAADAGIWVTNTPGQNSTAVAEHAVALLLSLARKIGEASAAVAAGRWGSAKADLVGVELRGKSLGLVGFGNIAQKVVPIARGFGMQVAAYDPFVPASVMAEHEVRALPLEELLRESDVVSLHLPLTPETDGLIGADQLDAMKASAFLVNTARGGLVDEQALLERIVDGRLAGAALDVLAAEQLDMEEPLRSSPPGLTAHDRLVITPHVGGQTVDSLRNVGMAALDCIEEALTGVRPTFAVNEAVSNPSRGPHTSEPPGPA